MKRSKKIATWDLVISTIPTKLDVRMRTVGNHSEFFIDGHEVLKDSDLNELRRKSINHFEDVYSRIEWTDILTCCFNTKDRGARSDKFGISGGFEWFERQSAQLDGKTFLRFPDAETAIEQPLDNGRDGSGCLRIYLPGNEESRGSLEDLRDAVADFYERIAKHVEEANDKLYAIKEVTDLCFRSDVFLKEGDISGREE